MFIFDNGDDNSDLNKLLPHNEKLFQAFKSFIEEKKYPVSVETMLNWRSMSRNEYFLINRDLLNTIRCFIFLDKQLFEEKIFNIIKDLHCFSDYLPTIRKELENQFDMKGEVFQKILERVCIYYYDRGDCVCISTILFDDSDKEESRYKNNCNFLVEKLTTLSSNIIKFFSKPEYYKDIMRNKISELEQDVKLLKCV